MGSISILLGAKRRIRRSNRVYPDTSKHEPLCPCNVCRRRRRHDYKLAGGCLVPLIIFIIALSFI